MQKINKIIFLLLFCTSCYSQCYYEVCVNSDSGSQTALQDFKQRVSEAMDKIKDVIKDTNDIMDKINDGQKEKAKSTVATNEIYKNILLDLMEQSHNMKKSNDLVCSDGDVEINKINTQILRVEALMSKIKK